MSERKELNEEMLDDVNGGLSAGEVIDGVRKVIDRQINNSKINLGLLGDVDLGDVIETVGKVLNDKDIKALKEVGDIITQNVKPKK